MARTSTYLNFMGKTEEAFANVSIHLAARP